MKKLASLPKFPVMIGMSIAISALLVFISMKLYFDSGAAQVDLSRPGYQSVRKHAQKTDSFEGFDSSETLSNETIDEFKAMFDRKIQEVEPYKNSFDGTPISNEDLEITAE